MAAEWNKEEQAYQDSLTDAHKSSDSMDEEVLRQLVTDLWAFINNAGQVTVHAETDGFYAGLRQRVIEALNLDE